MMHSRQTLRIVAEGLRPGAGGKEGARFRRGVADWLPVLALANEHLVVPALHASLSAAGALEDLPEEVRDYLAFLHAENGRRNGELRRQAEELVGALNRVGVEPMLLKGGLALFLDHYPDPAARIFRDLDLLVRVDEREGVLEALQGLGYHAAALYPEGHNAYGDFGRAGDPGAVDLHFELIDAPHVLPAREVWQRASRMTLPHANFFVPSPADTVLHTLLHAQIHHLGEYYRGHVELRQLHEFATLVRHYGAAIDWPFMASHLAGHRLSGPLQSYLLAANQLLDLAWPLAESPTRLARLQAQRSIAQIRFPLLALPAAPFANLCGAFAPYRMNGLYAGRGSLTLRRLTHAARFVHKSTSSAVVRRLFKMG